MGNSWDMNLVIFLGFFVFIKATELKIKSKRGHKPKSLCLCCSEDVQILEKYFLENIERKKASNQEKNKPKKRVGTTSTKDIVTLMKKQDEDMGKSTAAKNPKAVRQEIDYSDLVCEEKRNIKHLYLDLRRVDLKKKVKFEDFKKTKQADKGDIKKRKKKSKALNKTKKKRIQKKSSEIKDLKRSKKEEPNQGILVLMSGEKEDNEKINSENKSLEIESSCGTNSIKHDKKKRRKTIKIEEESNKSILVLKSGEKEENERINLDDKSLEIESSCGTNSIKHDKKKRRKKRNQWQNGSYLNNNKKRKFVKPKENSDQNFIFKIDCEDEKNEQSVKADKDEENITVCGIADREVIDDGDFVETAKNVNKGGQDEENITVCDMADREVIDDGDFVESAKQVNEGGQDEENTTVCDMVDREVIDGGDFVESAKQVNEGGQDEENTTVCDMVDREVIDDGEFVESAKQVNEGGQDEENITVCDMADREVIDDGEFVESEKNVNEGGQDEENTTVCDMVDREVIDDGEFVESEKNVNEGGQDEETRFESTHNSCLLKNEEVIGEIKIYDTIASNPDIINDNYEWNDDMFEINTNATSFDDIFVPLLRTNNN